MVQDIDISSSVPNRTKNPAELLQVLNDLMPFSDVVAGVLIGYLSSEFYLHGVRGTWTGIVSLGPLAPEIVLGSLIAALVLRGGPRATGIRGPGQVFVVTGLVQRAAAALALLLSLGVVTRALDGTARLLVFSWLALFAAYVVLSRCAAVMYLGKLTKAGHLREAVAVLGAPDVAYRIAERLAPDADVTTIIDDLDDGDDIGSGAVLNELRELASAGAIDTVILALRRGDGADLAPLLEQLKAVPVQLATREDGFSAAAASQPSRTLSGVQRTIVTDRPIAAWGSVQKSILDLFGAILLLIIMSPFMLAAALAIVLEGSGPIIFRQRRNGWSGRPFTIYKFRTMRCLSAGGTALQTEKNDPRCTRVGAFLRRTSIDELPQLWNVVRGEMSLVGPRPHVDSLHRNQRDGCQLIAEYAQRQRVKPGLTGWAQIHGLRGAVRTTAQMRRRVQYDLYYIEHWSIWLDLQILARTPLCVLSTENAF